MSKAFWKSYTVIAVFSIVILGLVEFTKMSQSNQKPYQIEHFTEMEQAKLENGEPVQIMSWYRTGEEWHAVYARKIPFKRYVQDNQILVYDVVLSGDEYYQQERFD